MEISKDNNRIKKYLNTVILVLFDIFSVNFAYYAAIAIRFKVENEFHTSALVYIDAFKTFAPYYTVIALAVFVLFKLYSSLWKYAGLNDLNRIIFATAATTVIQIIGTIAFVRRMPISYYCLGAVIQFCLVSTPRFFHRMLKTELEKMAKDANKSAVNAAIVGVGETARFVLKETDRNQTIRPVCMINYKGNWIDGMLNGIPVVNGLENLEKTIHSQKIKYVIIADAMMTGDLRNQIKAACKKLDVEVQDYFGFFENSFDNLQMRKVLECCTGSVELIFDGQSQKFANPEEALASITGSYMVQAMYAKANVLTIELVKHMSVKNDLSEEWVKKQEEETGEPISFF